MNKNSYSNLDHWTNIIYPSLARIEDYEWAPGETVITQKKEKTMNSEYKFHVTWESFKTLEEATKFARKQTMNSKEDTVIRQDVAVVRFPIPDYEVETLATVA